MSDAIVIECPCGGGRDDEEPTDLAVIHEGGSLSCLDCGAALAAPVPMCIYRGCCNSRRTRGLCHGHYQTLRTYIRDGKTTEAEQERKGLLMPKGTGQGRVPAGHGDFLNPDATGDAK